jgi:outer membrane protein assembly factor BamB
MRFQLDKKIKWTRLIRAIALCGVLTTLGFYYNADIAMWGETPARNMVSSETGLPANWDTESGSNIKWSQPLGSQTYGNPAIAGGRIFVGTNNQGMRNPKLGGDRGNIMAFRESDGEFLWQAAHPKLASGRVNDWPQQGICSGPFVEGNRLWYISNRCEVVCADVEGFRDGENDGPFTEEEESSEIDADFVWVYDMMEELDVFPHNLATCSPLVIGDLVFTVTANGVDETHINIPSPDAPSFIALNKKTGELVWEDASPGENILHGQWSNPAYGVINGKAQVIFPGGDGWIYSFVPETGKLIWKFDCNPKDSFWELGGGGTKNNIISTPVIQDNKVYVAVGQDPEHGEGIGHLWAIDATKAGDVTESGKVWHRGYEDFNRSISTVAIHDGLLYAADLSGFVYCLDAKTGEHYWTYDTFAAIWGSPMVADGKVYIGDEDGDIAILKAGKKMELLAEISMENAVYTTPVPKNGVLYVTNRSRLFAITMN